MQGRMDIELFCELQSRPKTGLVCNDGPKRSNLYFNFYSKFQFLNNPIEPKRIKMFTVYCSLVTRTLL